VNREVCASPASIVFDEAENRCNTIRRSWSPPGKLIMRIVAALGCNASSPRGPLTADHQPRTLGWLPLARTLPALDHEPSSRHGTGRSGSARLQGASSRASSPIRSTCSSPNRGDERLPAPASSATSCPSRPGGDAADAIEVDGGDPAFAAIRPSRSGPTTRKDEADRIARRSTGRQAGRRSSGVSSPLPARAELRAGADRVRSTRAASFAPEAGIPVMYGRRAGPDRAAARRRPSGDRKDLRARAAAAIATGLLSHRRRRPSTPNWGKRRSIGRFTARRRGAVGSESPRGRWCPRSKPPASSSSRPAGARRSARSQTRALLRAIRDANRPCMPAGLEPRTVA